MAIYHAHVSSGSRAGGQSGAAKVAYVLREGKYAGRYDLVVSGHGNLPAWAGGDPRALFAAADLHERANGRLFLEIEVALPNELDESQQHELVRSIAAAVTAPGLPFTYAIHAGRPKSAGEPANPHAHILISERVNDGVPRDAEQWFRRANRKRPELGGAAKHRDLKERSWVDDTRKLIAGLMNEHLGQARSPARVTSDSHATRIAQAVASGDVETAEYLRRHPPGIHLGPTLAALERDRFRQRKGEEPELSRAGEPTGRGDRNRAGAAEAERIREGMELVTTASGRAREEFQRAAEAVDAARSAGLSDEAIVGIYEDSESAESGSGWGAVEAAAAALAGRRGRAEAAAGELGIDLEAVYRSVAARGVDRVAAVERAASVFSSARSALLTDTQVWQIHGAAESAEQGSGWVAVEVAVAARVERKQLAETRAGEAGISADDIAGVYAAATSRDTDPLAALEEETVTQLAAEARRSARRTALFDSPGGREAYVAALAARDENGDPGDVSGADIDRALAAAEAADHLGRVRTIFEDEAGRSYYRAAARELGDRYGMQQITGAVTAAEEFVRRVGGLSDVGSGVLDAALGKDEELAAADHEAALERAEEEERKQAIRQREEQRWVELERRAEELRASGRGARWLREAEGEVLAGADRRPTLDEWGSAVRNAERLLSAHLDGLDAEIRKQSGGAALLRQLESNRIGDGSSQLTLRSREDIIDAALRWLRAWKRQEELFGHRDGELLYHGKLDELDPGWRATGRVRIKDVEQALEHGEATVAERERRAAALRERQLARRLGALRKHDMGEWLYTLKLDAPGRRQTGRANPARRERAIDWAERQVARIDVLRARDGASYLTGVDAARIPSAVERAIDLAEARLAARQREAAERARLKALDKEIVRRRAEVLRACPAAGGALLLEAGFGESRKKSEAALDEVEHSLADEFARREQVLRAGSGVAFLKDARRQVLGADRAPGTLGERGEVLVAAERARLEALDKEIARRRAEVLRACPAAGGALLLKAGFGKLREKNVAALDAVEHELAEDFARREQVLKAGSGVAFLKDVWRQVLGTDRAPGTLGERGEVLVAAERLRAAAADRRSARHQMVSETPGGGERLRAAGWREARTDRARDRVLDDVEHELDADFVRREHQLRSDAEGEACLRRGRLQVLEADREPETLAERGRVIERAAKLQQAAVADRARRAANQQRLARLTRLFAVPAGDAAFFTALAAHKPAWRQKEIRPADVDIALDRAEQDVDRRKPRAAAHEVVVEAERKFPDTPSAAWRQAAERFPEAATHARAVPQRLSDRARVRALAAERAEPPSSPDLVQRLFDWLKALLLRLGLVKPVTRQSPASGAAQPAPATPAARSAPEPARSPAAIARRLDLGALGQRLEEKCLPRYQGVLAASNSTMRALVRKLDAGDWTDYVARKALDALAARHRDDEEQRGGAEVALHMRAFRAAAAEEQARRWVTLSDDDKERIGGQVVHATLPAVVQQIRSMCREVLVHRAERPADHKPPPGPMPQGRALGTAAEQSWKRAEDPEWDPGDYSR